VNVVPAREASAKVPPADVLHPANEYPDTAAEVMLITAPSA